MASANDGQATAPAPGDRGSFHFGLWAILSMAFCFPVGLGLGIAAIVQYQKAKALAAQTPTAYRTPPAAGLVMGILALALFPVLVGMVGIAGAIAIPAYLGYRARTRDRAAVLLLSNRSSELLADYERLSAAKVSGLALRRALEAHLETLAGADRNPWNPAAPAFSYHIDALDGADHPGLATQAAAARATELGQVVFVLQLPGAAPNPQPGYLAGAVRTEVPVSGAKVVTRVLLLHEPHEPHEPGAAAKTPR